MAIAASEGDNATVIKGTRIGWIPALAGIALLSGGVAISVWPGRSVKLVTLIVGIALVANGVFETISATALRHQLDGWGYHLASGIWSTAFGLPLALAPEFSARALAVLLGIFLMIGGLIGVLVGASLRSRGGRGGHYVVRGILTLALGTTTVVWPHVTLTVIVVLAAVWMIIIGAMLITVAAGISRTGLVVVSE